MLRWTGSELTSLQGAANLVDRFAKHNGPSGWVCDEELFDGYVGHSPVGTFRSNAFGFHDVHGNVWEWCRDGNGEYAKNERSPGDAELIVAGARYRVYRGGSFNYPPVSARVSYGRWYTTTLRSGNLGCRPAGVITD